MYLVTLYSNEAVYWTTTSLYVTLLSTMDENETNSFPFFVLQISEHIF